MVEKPTKPDESGVDKDLGEGTGVTEDRDEEPEVFALARRGGEWALSRRGFLAGAAAGGVVVAGACSESSSEGERWWPSSPGAEPQRPREEGTKGAGQGGAVRRPSKCEPVDVMDSRDGCTRIESHDEAITSIALSPDGRLLASAGQDKAIRLWTFPDGDLQRTINLRDGVPESLAISPEGDVLAAAMGDGTIRLLSLPRGRQIRTLEGGSASLWPMVFSPDGRFLAIANFGNFDLWSVPDGRITGTYGGHSSAITALSFSEDGSVLTSASPDSLRTWSLPNVEETGSVPLVSGSAEEGGRVMALSPGGGKLISLRDRTLSIRSARDGSLITAITDHESSEPARSLAISQDGEVVLTGSASEGLRLWSVEQGCLTKQLRGVRGISALAMSPDRRYVAAASDQSITIWSLPEMEMISCLMDRRITRTTAKGVQFRVRSGGGSSGGSSGGGEWVTRTMPCGSPIPPGAVCTCNCVAGSWTPPRPPVTRPRSRGRGRRRGTGYRTYTYTYHYWHPN